MTRSNRTRKAIYPGTFDPVTNGHISLIERSCALFDKTVVAIAKNGGKSPTFDFDERFKLMTESVAKLDCRDKVKVIGFDGLLADLAIKTKAHAIIRGLRALSDFEYEFQMALMNRKLARTIETVFLMPSLSWVYLSSSLVKEVARNQGEISSLVPAPVNRALKMKFSSRS